MIYSGKLQELPTTFLNLHENSGDIQEKSRIWFLKQIFQDFQVSSKLAGFFAKIEGNIAFD